MTKILNFVTDLKREQEKEKRRRCQPLRSIYFHTFSRHLFSFFRFVPVCSRSGSTRHHKTVQQSRPIAEHKSGTGGQHAQRPLFVTSGGGERIRHAPREHWCGSESPRGPNLRTGTATEGRSSAPAGRQATSEASGGVQGETGDYGKFELAR